MTQAKIKILKYSLISAFSLFAIFSITLVVHIAMMVGNKSASSFHQLARIDFNESSSISEIQKIEQELENEEGFVGTYLNKEDKIMVYKFDKRYNNATQIYENTIKTMAPDSKRYVVTKEMATNGCPVISDDSFYGKLTATITNIMY